MSQRRAATEKRFFEAALKIILEEGFQALRVNHIGGVAGVDKTLVYRYFSDIEGLCQRLVEHHPVPSVTPTSDDGILDAILADPIASALFCWELILPENAFVSAWRHWRETNADDPGAIVAELHERLGSGPYGHRLIVNERRLAGAQKRLAKAASKPKPVSTEVEPASPSPEPAANSRMDPGETALVEYDDELPTELL